MTWTMINGVVLSNLSLVISAKMKQPINNKLTRRIAILTELLFIL